MINLLVFFISKEILSNYIFLKKKKKKKASKIQIYWQKIHEITISSSVSEM